MSHLALARRLLFALVALIPAVAAAQFNPQAIKPGRDPRQPIDSAYTAKIKEYTTETFFLSPLVDYLPASKTVPTPTAVLGDIAGSPTKLPYSSEVYDYMRRLAAAAPKRVKVWSIGKTEEGREHIAVAVASDKLMAQYEANKARLAKLADPRTINHDDAQAARLIAESVPVYYLTGTIHSTEAGAPTALMELAYRLAVDDSPYIRNIRDNVITVITPVVEVDGRDKMVDIFKWHMARPNETWPNLIYWGKYVAHDNNRDAMGMTLALSRNILNTYVDTRAIVLHDLHESVPFLYDNTIGDGPYNAWVDPILTNEWQMVGWQNVNEMTRMGMPGVFAFGSFDTWSPGYLMFHAALHNGISRLYETFGNGGTAETLEREIAPNATARTWFRQNPPLPRVRWSLRNNNNYQQTGILTSLAYFANNKTTFLGNFWEKSKRSVAKPKVEGPAAYVLPANDPRLGAQADLLAVMQRQHVEVHKATSAFTVQVPVRRGAGRGNAGRGGTTGAGQQPAQAAAPVTGGTSAQPIMPQTEPREFPAGSYIIRLDQPYSRAADALLDYQYWAPNDPQRTPYDDTGWTLPETFGTQAIRVTDLKVLDVPVEKVTGSIVAPGGVSGSGAIFAINANGDNALASLRYKLRDADIQAAESSFDVGSTRFNRGSFVVRGVAQAEFDRATKELGLRATALAAAPAVRMHPVRAARVAVMHTWQTTQTEGWWRMAFDNVGIPYDYISTQDIAKTPNLNAKWDVIVFAPGPGGAAIVDGMPMWRNAMPWKNTPETPNIPTWAQTDDMRPGLGYNGLEMLKTFVKNGGVLITAASTSEWAIQVGLTNGVTANSAAARSVVGSYLRSRIVDDASPLAYGMADNLSLYSEDGGSMSVSALRGGRGGGGGGAGARETGRGQSDERDQVQGFPQLEARFLPLPQPTVQPWEYAPVAEAQLRNGINVIPPDQRPRVVARWGAQNELLVSGLLQGGGDIAQRPVVVDAPLDRGHVILFASNPVWRGYTHASYGFVFNAIMHHDNLKAGRKLDPR